MTTLTDFLLARIAEDEAAANDPRYVWSADIGEPVQNPARVLAECAAHRQIIANLTSLAARQPIDDWSPADSALIDTIRALAATYADHPDYRPEWAL